MQEEAKPKLGIRYVLRKFTGDPKPENLREAIVVVDDEIVETWTKGDNRLPPED